ncbi:hypothetical protein CHS0354_001344 [Potamilus streckersoni]|uniref:Uncharacterized protein n=1 Tax=Potamilus streckersoni TaxID=2493646 RepID=A0AAE0TFJ7_9BIVA|nr:hypothetical protein CHS0354_001344 [Potamilus streckersoni]
METPSASSTAVIPSKSPSANQRSRSPSANQRSRSPSANQRSRSPSVNQRSRSPSVNQRSRSPSANQSSESPSDNRMICSNCRRLGHVQPRKEYRWTRFQLKWPKSTKLSRVLRGKRKRNLPPVYLQNLNVSESDSEE